MEKADLLEKVIKMAVKEALKEGVLSELKALREEVKKLKSMTAHIIKEGVSAPAQYAQPGKSSLLNTVSTNKPSVGQNIAPRRIGNPAPQATMNDIINESFSREDLAQASLHGGFDDTAGLPDVDIPPMFFLDTNSRAYHDVMSKIQS